MKPEEFDVLLKQKFDQNDFEYNPRNWDKLAEELDGRTKKRGLLVWWMPLIGVAASVALAFGVTSVLRDGSIAPKGLSINAAIANHTISQAETATDISTSIQNANVGAQHVVTSFHTHTPTTKTDIYSHSGEAKINMENVIAYSGASKHIQKMLDEVNQPEENQPANITTKTKKAVHKTEGYYTFKDQPKIPKAPAKASIILSGGVNYSSQSTGYTVGATGRRMINSKVYVESDVAFTGTNNSAKTYFLEKSQSTPGATGMTANQGVAARTTITTAKTTIEQAKNANPDPEIVKTGNESYNLYYAQVTPSIGYKIMKKLSVGIGPDFQQMLVDNRPTPSTLDRNNITEVPMFDVGFMGKMECTISGNVKAAVSYREGINNIITPNNSYIDRNYVQFQLKYAIFNKK